MESDAEKIAGLEAKLKSSQDEIRDKNAEKERV